MQSPEATVVGASLVSFIPGVTLAQRQAVKLAALWAESTTVRAMAGKPAAEQYHYYRRQLKYLGWDATSAEEVHWPDPQRPAIVDQALRKIDALAGERHSNSMALAFQALRKGGLALLHFELRSREHGAFKLLSCAPMGANSVDMVIYHEAGSGSHLTAGFLFRQRSNSHVYAELVRFNTRLFDQEHRSKVLRATEKISLEEIHAAQI
ncbi:hypothetical protein CCOS865_05067 [Pseudomonas reidholzensis]|uniref:Uncharacterized protein n=1 Tax=Pseudomonas reidholzensis TaxID=1785162 RepID=A0A383S0S1_9PSED|nr:hypothetical protein [Pseudomonas reidholzensis]SYX92775.1 hypothetical protein CCOS865_05067 [Pseudomonas reidholzensis]